MAYTTLSQGSSVTITINDQFDGLEVINRTQDLATVALASGAWAYGATPQQHSGRRVYQLNGAGSITLTASSGALQYEYTDAADNRVAQSFSVAETASIRSLVLGAGARAFYSLVSPASMSGVSEVILGQFILTTVGGVSVLGLLSRLELRMSLSKSNTAESVTIRIRCGTTGTISDTQIYTSGSLLVTTNISAGALLDFKRTTTTALQKLGAGLSSNAYGGASTVAYATPVTVGVLDDAANYISVTAQSSAGAETITLQDLQASIVI